MKRPFWIRCHKCFLWYIWRREDWYQTQIDHICTFDPREWYKGYWTKPKPEHPFWKRKRFLPNRLRQKRDKNGRR